VACEILGASIITFPFASTVSGSIWARKFLRAELRRGGGFEELEELEEGGGLESGGLVVGWVGCGLVDCGSGFGSESEGCSIPELRKIQSGHILNKKKRKEETGMGEEEIYI
jgi:hypothetical protein